MLRAVHPAICCPHCLWQCTDSVQPPGPGVSEPQIRPINMAHPLLRTRLGLSTAAHAHPLSRPGLSFLSCPLLATHPLVCVCTPAAETRSPRSSLASSLPSFHQLVSSSFLFWASTSLHTHMRASCQATSIHARVVHSQVGFCHQPGVMGWQRWCSCVCCASALCGHAAQEHSPQ